MLRVIVWVSMLSVRSVFCDDEILGYFQEAGMPGIFHEIFIDKFIWPDQPFPWSCPTNDSHWFIDLPTVSKKDEERIIGYGGEIYLAGAGEDEMLCCRRSQYEYSCNVFKWKNCSDSRCKNGGECIEVNDGIGIPHYDCHCPYKTRGFDCGERYQGIEWLVALLWAAVLGEIALMVIALCRHKHQRHYCGVANKKRFVDVLNDTKKDFS